MPVRLLALPLALALAACSGTASETSADTPRLGAEAEGAGWIVLFDGESTDGWRGYNRDDLPSAWSVQDGALTFAPGTGDGGDILAPGLYEDFELELEWTVGACGNSGVFYHVEEIPELRATWQTGLEMQVLDGCHSDARFPSHRAGALYDLYVPLAEAARPAGEWNAARIRVEDGQITHTLNGQVVVRADMGSEDWSARVAASKFRDAEDFPAYGTRRSGAIGLQDHGDPVSFRSIRIRRL